LYASIKTVEATVLGVARCWNNLALQAFIRKDRQTDMAWYTRLVILIKNIYT